MLLKHRGCSKWKRLLASCEVPDNWLVWRMPCPAFEEAGPIVRVLFHQLCGPTVCGTLGSCWWHSDLQMQPLSPCSPWTHCNSLGRIGISGQVGTPVEVVTLDERGHLAKRVTYGEEGHIWWSEDTWWSQACLVKQGQGRTLQQMEIGWPGMPRIKEGDHCSWERDML